MTSSTGKGRSAGAGSAASQQDAQSVSSIDGLTVAPTPIATTESERPAQASGASSQKHDQLLSRLVDNTAAPSSIMATGNSGSAAAPDVISQQQDSAAIGTDGIAVAPSQIASMGTGAPAEATEAPSPPQEQAVGTTADLTFAAFQLKSQETAPATPFQKELLDNKIYWLERYNADLRAANRRQAQDLNTVIDRKAAHNKNLHTENVKLKEKVSDQNDYIREIRLDKNAAEAEVRCLESQLEKQQDKAEDEMWNEEYRAHEYHYTLDSSDDYSDYNPEY